MLYYYYKDITKIIVVDMKVEVELEDMYFDKYYYAYEPTGEYRLPRSKEYYLGPADVAQQAYSDFVTEKYFILNKLN